MRETVYFSFMSCLLTTTVYASGYYLQITSNAPVVSGATVNFEAKLFEGGKPAYGSFKFSWEDNSLLKHSGEIETDSPHCQWSVNYSSGQSPPGPYEMQVTVYKFWVFYFVATSQRYLFYLTDSLNGEMQLVQSNKTIEDELVANTSVVLHKIVLKDSDREYLNQSATQVLTYWFFDCNYIGVTDNNQLAMNYTEIDKPHQMDAFIMADFSPIPTEAPTTTTTTTTTSTTPKSTTKMQPKTRKRRDLLQNTMNFKNVSEILYRKHHTMPNATTNQLNFSFPFVCNNHTIIPVGPKMAYGLFSRNITAKEPISKVSVQGNNWIQPFDMLELAVSCNGSSSFEYCYIFKNGLYNVTGNETCPSSYTVDKCQFTIYRLFLQEKVDVHTIVIIISNGVSKEISPVTVTLYKATKQAQLSVIVVPVVFSLVATVLIIFGAAYYWQSRTRYTVEVADFNFGQDFGELEYKTFTDRLKEALINAFTRAPTPSGSSEGPVWPPGSQSKYDEMP